MSQQSPSLAKAVNNAAGNPQQVRTGVDPTKAQTVKALTPPPFYITPLQTAHKYFKMMVYGASGSGKTTLCASSVDVPQMRDVLMINAESGTMSIEEASHIKNRFLIDQVRCTDFKMVAYAQEFLKAHCVARDQNNVERLKALQARIFNYDEGIIVDDPTAQDEYEIDEDDGSVVWKRARLRRYRTALIDSLTEIDVLSMYALLGISTDMKLDKEMDVAEWGEFRKNNQLMQLLVRAYRDLPMNVLIVTAIQWTQDETKRFFYTPALTGQLSRQVQGFVDLVGYLQTGKPEEQSKQIPRRLMIQPIGNFDAKSRLANFKDVFIADPSMTKIMAAFQNRTTAQKS